MPFLSSVTAVPFIAERSEATPGLWNKIFSVISQNADQVNTDVFATAIATPPIAYNAGAFVGGSLNTSNLSGIQAAINKASSTSGQYVYIPQNLLPYDATQISFNTLVRMVREGGVDWTQYDVMAYGAAGNGIQDDTVAIQSAISNVPIAGGRVFIPLGTFKLSNHLLVQRGSITIEGAGMEVANLKQTSVATVFSFFSTANIRRVRFANLSLNANLTAPLALSLLTAGDMIIENVNIDNALRAVYSENAIHMRIVNCRISGVASNSTWTGLQFASGGGGATTVTLQDNYIEAFSVGIDNNCVNLRSMGNIFESVKTGVLNAANGFLAIGDYHELNVSNSVGYDMRGGAMATIIHPHSVGTTKVVVQTSDYAGATERLTVLYQREGLYIGSAQQYQISAATTNLAQSRLLSIRTRASLDSVSLATDETAFALTSSGASLAIRSGGTVWYFSSSASTKG